MKSKTPRTAKTSLYGLLRQKLAEKTDRDRGAGRIELGATIRALRQEKKTSGAELCRTAGDLDARTLAAVEAGRIRNPSIKTLQSVARGLGVSVSELFRRGEVRQEYYFSAGSPKGVFQMDFTGWGVRAVSFTPLIKDFFSGKFIVGARRKIDQTFLSHPRPIYLSVLVGRFEVMIEDRQLSLKEGENLFFNGILKHSFYNPLQRDSVFLLTTAPSFL